MNIFSKGVVVLGGFLTMSVVTSDGYAAEKLDLKLRLKPGQKHSMRIITENKISHTIMGQQQKINHHKTVELEFEVKDVQPSAAALVKVTYLSLKEKTESNQGDFEYDSTKPETFEGNPLAMSYNAMIGQGFVMKITPDGKVAKLRGIDEMCGQMAEKIVDAEDVSIKKRIRDRSEVAAEGRAKKSIKALNKRYGSREKRVKATKEMIKKDPIFAEVQIMKMVRNAITVFPDRPVGIGDSWEAKVIPPYAPLSEIGVAYMLDGNDKGVVSIDVSSKIDLDEDDFSDSTKKGPKPQMKMTGIYHGTLQIDKTSGWMIGKEVKMRLSGQVTQQGMTVPMSIESVVTVESMKNRPAK